MARQGLGRPGDDRTLPVPDALALSPGLRFRPDHVYLTLMRNNTPALARRQFSFRHFGVVVGLCLAAAAFAPRGHAAASSETSSALESDAQGWTDILPSPDLKGWSRVPVPPTGKLGRAQWHVDSDEKTLVCDGDGGHDMLLWNTEVGDAIFHFEFRYTKIEDKTGYNSGAYVRNSKDGAIWHQAQFGDAKDGFLFGETLDSKGNKKFFSLKNKVTDPRVKPAGEWNTMEVTARGKTLTLWVNGAVTCEFEDCGAPTGLVGLEGEGYRIEFRNLKVKKLH